MKTVLQTILLVLVMFASCATPGVRTPDGFLMFNKKTDYYIASSADGIIISVREIKGVDVSENSSLNVWLDETDRVLKSKAYALISETRLDIESGGSAYLREYLVIYNSEEYVYTLTLAVIEKKLLLVESGGRKADYDLKRNDIVSSIKSLKDK